MKKLIITSTFEGSVVATYGESGVGANMYPPLLKVEFGGAVLSDEQKSYILSRMPMRVMPGLDQAFPTAKIHTVLVEEELDFERDFWIPYAHKVNKERAIKEWKRLSEEDRGLAVAGLGAYFRHLKNSSYNRAKAGADKYLREKYWRSEWDKV